MSGGICNRGIAARVKAKVCRMVVRTAVMCSAKLELLRFSSGEPEMSISEGQLRSSRLETKLEEKG